MSYNPWNSECSTDTESFQSYSYTAYYYSYYGGSYAYDTTAYWYKYCPQGYSYSQNLCCDATYKTVGQVFLWLLYALVPFIFLLCTCCWWTNNMRVRGEMRAAQLKEEQIQGGPLITNVNNSEVAYVQPNYGFNQ